MNCVDSCPDSSLHFGFGHDGATTVYSPDIRRRQALTGVVAGLAIVPLLRSTNGLAVENHDRLLRPPGSLEESDFLSRCIRCGECMKVCPNNALHPSLTDAGIEGLWTPVLVPRVGYCAPNCSLCSSVCPTGAIAKISSADKGWHQRSAGDSAPIRLGTAFFDRGRCVTWAEGVECGACEKACPTEPRAIYLREGEVVDSSGTAHTVKQPWIDASRCVGCGSCEYTCPLHDRPAVYVTSVGESRSPNNRIFVNGRDLTSAS
jgi:ferredoxin